jgi:hypothetical protein
MIQFERLRFPFTPATGGPRSDTRVAIFSGTVNNADCSINGFDIGFTQGEHPLFRLQIDSSTELQPRNAVRVTVTFALRDNSGLFDDQYNGFVDILVIADVT